MNSRSIHKLLRYWQNCIQWYGRLSVQECDLECEGWRHSQLNQDETTRVYDGDR